MLARVLSSFERHEEALAAAQRSVSLDPLAVMLHTILADVLLRAPIREGGAVVSHGDRLDPRFASAHTDLARALEALGRFDEARAAYETGQRLSGGIAGPSFGLAHLEAAAGNVAEAAHARRTHDGASAACRVGLGNRRRSREPW